MLGSCFTTEELNGILVLILEGQEIIGCNQRRPPSVPVAMSTTEAAPIDSSAQPKASPVKATTVTNETKEYDWDEFSYRRNFSIYDKVSDNILSSMTLEERISFLRYRIQKRELDMQQREATMKKASSINDGDLESSHYGNEDAISPAQIQGNSDAAQVSDEMPEQEIVPEIFQEIDEASESDHDASSEKLEATAAKLGAADEKFEDEADMWCSDKFSVNSGFSNSNSIVGDVALAWSTPSPEVQIENLTTSLSFELTTENFTDKGNGDGYQSKQPLFTWQWDPGGVNHMIPDESRWANLGMCSSDFSNGKISTWMFLGDHFFCTPISERGNPFPSLVSFDVGNSVVLKRNVEMNMRHLLHFSGRNEQSGIVSVRVNLDLDSLNVIGVKVLLPGALDFGSDHFVRNKDEGVRLDELDVDRLGLLILNGDSAFLSLNAELTPKPWPIIASCFQGGGTTVDKLAELDYGEMYNLLNTQAGNLLVFESNTVPMRRGDSFLVFLKLSVDVSGVNGGSCASTVSCDEIENTKIL